MEITNVPQTSPPPNLAVSKEGSNLVFCNNGEVFLSEFRSSDITATHENTPSGRELFVDFRCAAIMAPWGGRNGKVFLGYVDGSKYSLTLEEEEHLSNSSNQLGQMLILYPKCHPSSIVQLVVHKSFCFHFVAAGGDEDGRIPIYVKRVSKGGKAELFIQAISNISTPKVASASLETETIELIDRKWARDENEHTPFAFTPNHSLSPPRVYKLKGGEMPNSKLNVGGSFLLSSEGKRWTRNSPKLHPFASAAYSIPHSQEWMALIGEQSEHSTGGVVILPKFTGRRTPLSQMELPDGKVLEYFESLGIDANIVQGNSLERHFLRRDSWANDIEDTQMTSSSASVIQLHGRVLAGAAGYNDPITTIQKHFKQKIDGFFEHWSSSSSPPDSIIRITQAVQEIEGLLLQNSSVNDYSYSNFLEDSEPYLEVINEEVNKMFKDNTGSLIRHLLCEYLHTRFAHMFSKRVAIDMRESLLGGDHNEVLPSSSFNIRSLIQGIIRKSRDLLLLMGEKVHDEIVVGYVSDIVQSFMSENMNEVGQSVFPPMQKVLYGISISCLISSWMLRPTENENTAPPSSSSSSTRRRTLRRNELSCMMLGLWLFVALLRFSSSLYAPLPFAYGAIAVSACIIAVLAPGLYSLES